MAATTMRNEHYMSVDDSATSTGQVPGEAQNVSEQAPAVQAPADQAADKDPGETVTIDPHVSARDIADNIRKSNLFSKLTANYCTMSIKMACLLGRDGSFECPRCQERCEFYKEGEEIPIFITDNTMAGVSRDYFETEGFCSHFEIFEYKNLSTLEIFEQVFPKLEVLGKHNKLKILASVGLNDLIRGTPIDNIKLDLKMFSDTVQNMGNASIKFVEVPFPPLISKFPKDKYDILRDLTKEIVSFNLYVVTINETFPPFYKDDIPSLSMEGISYHEFDEMPTENIHLSLEWVGTPLCNATLLTNEVRRLNYEGIINFYRVKGSAS